MTQDFFLGQLRMIAVAIIAYATGRGWLSSADSSLAGAILAPAGLLIGPWIWSIYSNINRKLVPHDSVAVQPVGGTPTQKGDVVTMGGTTVGKVVGAILLAFTLTLFVQASAFAADKAVPNDPLGALKNFAIADIQGALDDATANNDTSAVACWSALLPLVQAQQAVKLQKFGVFTALQKSRDVVRNVDMLRAGIGPVADLKNKCAAIIVDTNTFLLRLGIVGAGASVGLPF